VTRFPVERWRLANGLTVVLQRDHRWPMIVSTVCYATGSRHDPPARAGLAHACEHLAFYGPQRAADGGTPGDRARTYAGRIERAGGSARAATLPDRVSFSSAFPRGALAAILAVEAERMAEPFDSSDAASLEIQRRVLIDELRQRSQNRIHAAAVEHAHRLLFPESHPYHRPAAGEPDGIAAITPEDVRAFAAARFTPRSAILVLVGDLPVGVDALVRRLFEPLSGGDVAAGPGVRAETDRTTGGLITRELTTRVAGATPLDEATRPDETMRLDEATRLGVATRSRAVAAPVPGPQAYVAWEVPGFGQPGWHEAVLLVRAISAGRSSPLARRLVDARGLARGVHGVLVTMRDASTLVLSAAAAPGVDRPVLEQALVDEADRALAGRVDSGVIARARTKALSDHYFEMQNLERRADLCAAYACHLDAPERIENEARRYEDIEPEAIETLAFATRRARRRAVLSLVPAAEAA
jgi:zinc protease